MPSTLTVVTPRIGASPVPTYSTLLSDWGTATAPVGFFADTGNADRDIKTSSNATTTRRAGFEVILFLTCQENRLLTYKFGGFKKGR
ncbi:MAG: hypothetical protein WBS20_11865 [Lysobacterales bacterium]